MQFDQTFFPSLEGIIPRPGYYPLPQASPYHKNPSSLFGYNHQPFYTATHSLRSGPFETPPPSHQADLKDFFGYWLAPRDRGPDPDPLREFMQSKRRFLSRSVEDVLGLIDERIQIKYDNMRQIDDNSCQQKTRLFTLEHWIDGLNPNVDRLRSTIEKELVGLEREKLMEEVACWRDLSRLRGELREIMAEYAQEKRKDSLFSEGK